MLSIRPATIDDAALLTAMIRELAEYEHLAHEVSMTEADILRDGFGPQPKFRSVIALWEGEPVGYAVFFEFYSSFQGRAGLFLDDLFVRPASRQHGIGTALFARVANIAEREGRTLIKLSVLDWNQAAIDLYKALGGEFLDEWREVVLTGNALHKLAEKDS